MFSSSGWSMTIAERMRQPDGRMRHDVRVLLRRERAGLVRISSRTPILPMSCSRRTERHRAPHDVCGRPQLARDGRRVLAHPHAVPMRVRILRFERLGQRLDAAEELLLDAARLRLHLLLEPVLVVAVLEHEAPAFEHRGDPGPDLLQMERLGEVVQRPHREAADRRLHVAVATDHHDRRVGPAGAELTQEREAVHASASRCR